MTKANYMALADFQEIWSNKIKPAIPAFRDIATVETCEACVTELL